MTSQAESREFESLRPLLTVVDTVCLGVSILRFYKDLRSVFTRFVISHISSNCQQMTAKVYGGMHYVQAQLQALVQAHQCYSQNLRKEKPRLEWPGVKEK